MDGTDRKQLLKFKSYEFKTIKLRNVYENEPLLFQLPPDPLHVNLLGPAVDALNKMKEFYPAVCLEQELDTDFALILKDYEANFDYLYTHFGLNMTLKCHVILHHYEFYFLSTGKTFRDTNGEFVETVHSSLRIHEESHGYKVVKQIGTPEHLKKSQQSITSFNSLRAGFCSPKDFTLRRKSSPHSSSPSPSPLSSPKSSHLYPLHLMF